MEAKRIQDEKEKEVQKLRDQQEKASNRQEEIDAVRAKRAFEQSERDARAREKLEQEKKLRLLKDLDEARQKQFRDRENLLATQAAEERDQFLNIIQAQKEADDKERRIEEQKRQAFKTHHNQLRSQIEFNEEVKKQEKLDYLEEGRKIR